MTEIVMRVPEGIETVAPTDTPTPRQTRTPVPRPTNTQRPANITWLSTPTPQTQCYRWDEINSSMFGQEVCVYGVVTRYDENWEYELTYFYFGSREEFFLVSSYRWDSSVEGSCIAAEGSVSLNIYKTPYIEVKEIYACES